MTQLSQAKKGITTSEMLEVASQERLSPELIRERIARGEIIIPKNKKHNFAHLRAIGRSTKTKVNTNIGTSTDCVDINFELSKLRAAEEAGTDTIMDLSTGGNLNSIRQSIIKASSLAVGTVPVYQAVVETVAERKALVNMAGDKIFEVIEKQAEDGVDFVTVHCGLTQASLERLIKQGRVEDIVSRGGAFLTTWMIANQRENPLYEQFDRLLEIAGKYDLTLSLGDGLRPGCIADSTDRPQVQELILLGELAKKAFEADVQVMIEGPGHIPFHEIKANVLLEKKLCNNAPFYVLGPVVTDVAPGYDHITSAIGGAYASASGADFLCYVTPGEHLRLPTLEDVKQGVIATRIAAHAGDIAKGVKGAANWDLRMAQSRKKRNWKEQIELSINPELAQRMREESQPHISDVCTMCGEYCALKLVESALRSQSHKS